MPSGLYYIRYCFIFLILTFAVNGRAHSADFTTSLNGCTVNWTEGTIIATGKARIAVQPAGVPVDYYDRQRTSLNGARRQSYSIARDVAMEKLFSALKLISLEPGIKLNDIYSNSYELQQRLSTTACDFVRVKIYPAGFDTSRCEVILSIGNLINLLPYHFPSDDFPTLDDPTVPTEYTSLIIDGRGLGLKPMIFPSVYNEDGLEIYSRIFVDIRHAGRYGMASYCFSENQARASKRAGLHPYYTVALKNLNGCPVISDADARKVLSSDGTRNNLKKCRVILILDREK